VCFIVSRENWFMKILQYSVALCFALASCRKTNSSGPESSILGEWELRRMYGGGGMVDTLYSTNNGTLFRFHEQDYQEYIEHVIKSTGTYTLTKDTVYQSDPSKYVVLDKINLNSSVAESHIIHLNKDSLIVDYGASAFDGVERVYIKKQ
jgi:hypothetical protein